ncbi:glycosyltransferase [Ligilactobacillus aviarius]|uniref:glycosyltransferase n=1 Tax=Ligilactobacillus aviarius TaxID=1606 RepID=UPI00249E8E52|nr:glycosyltransferase [Ligilactobacillus aviarius]
MSFSYIPVIVTFNRKDKLITAIQSVLDQTIQPQKIVIVDNHSDDGTQDLVKKNYQDEIDNGLIDYHYLPENIGGSGGFSKGVKYANKYETDYIAVSDDDAFYRKDYFEKISDAAKENSSVKAFQGVAYDSNIDKISIQGKKIINWNSLDSENIKMQKQDIYADLATFVGFVFTKKIVSKIGYPVDNFFIWNDDAEYSLRMRNITKILQVKNAIVDHAGTQRIGGTLTPIWKTYYGFRNKIVLRRKYSKSKLAAQSINVFLLVRQVAAAVLKSSYKGKRRAYIKAFIDGFRDAQIGKMGKNKKYMPQQGY